MSLSGVGFSGAVEDRLAIRELLDRYADAVMRRDAIAWGATWAEDGVWSLHKGDVVGRDRIVAAWVEAMASLRFVAFYTQPGSVEIAGDTGTGVSYTLEFITPTAGEKRRQSGRYDDGFVRRDRLWLFQSRRFTALKDPA